MCFAADSSALHHPLVPRHPNPLPKPLHPPTPKALSVEGQVARLISEAVDHENLGRMYIWWMSFM